MIETMQRVLATLAILAILPAVPLGCQPSDVVARQVADVGDDDTDSPFDTSWDSEQQTDGTSALEFSCGQEPESCADVLPDGDQGENSCCYGNRVYQCLECESYWLPNSQHTECVEGQEFLFFSADCSVNGSTCGWDEEQDYLGCVAENQAAYRCESEPETCDDVGESPEAQDLGCCWQNRHYRCDPDSVLGPIVDDCYWSSAVCSYWNSQHVVACLHADALEDLTVCDGEPQFCDDIGSNSFENWYGCCWGNAVYWCDTGDEIHAHRRSCTYVSQVCGYDEVEDRMDCIP